MSTYRPSKMLASTDEEAVWKTNERLIKVHFMDDPVTKSVLDKLRSGKLYPGHGFTLFFENMKGNAAFPVIDIYINLTQTNTPEEDNYVGSMALYGIEQGDIGQDRSFNVTNALTKVSKKPSWSAAFFSLALVPLHMVSEDHILSIGRIALYLIEDLKQS